jgi:predicted nucleotide-binding protein
MAAKQRYLFVSYAREDLDRIESLIDALKSELEFRALPIEIWRDISNLRPGEQWNETIMRALESSVGFLFLVSPRSLKSDWVRRELEIAASKLDRLIIPVILHKNLDLPRVLAERQYINLSGRPTQEKIAEAASQIADVTENYLKKSPKPKVLVSDIEAPKLAAEIAKEVRIAAEPDIDKAHKNSVFVVHGHDIEALGTIESYLESEGIAAVVLSREGGSSQSLFQKFMAVAKKARFAVVLLGADDYGASRDQYDADGVADRALQFRARQNVILELGFFYGKLGWENVFVVYRSPDKIFPNFERPSDLDGILFDSMSDEAWQEKLGSKLAAAGFDLKRSPNKTFSGETRNART